MKPVQHQSGDTFPKAADESYQVSGKISKLNIFLPLAPIVPTIVYDTYWRFAAKRQDIFFKRFFGELPPWTDDEVLRVHKFTNAYRASDRVSQYLIRRVIYREDCCDSIEETLFRIILFKLFNKIETWELLERKLKVLSWKTYSFEAYDKILSGALANKTAIYSAAYIMASGMSAFGELRKHQNHLRLIESMMRDGLPKKVSKARNMQTVFDLLGSYPTIGDFLAYQFATDINYSTLTDFDEMDFVVPGPGALDGIRKTFSNLGGLNEGEIIKVMSERQDHEFKRLELSFKSLWGRPLQLIDCQNLFCEVDKYSRIVHPECLGLSGRTRIKQKFAENTDRINYWYPPKWGINKKVAEDELLREKPELL